MYYIPNKLLYVAIPKTGSTAITQHLNSVFDHEGDDCIETRYEDCSFHPSIWDIKSSCLTEDAFFCTVVRNPYSRFVSHYFYCLYVMECWEKHQSTPYGKKLIDKWTGTKQELLEFKQKNTHLGGYQNNLYLDKPTEEHNYMKQYFNNVDCFEDYVHKFYELDLVESFFLRQIAFTSFAWNYTHKKMNFVGKSEELQQSCDFICKSINAVSYTHLTLPTILLV